MSPNKLESESRMVPKEQIDSPPSEEGGSSGGGRLKKGPWTAAEDVVLRDYVKLHGEGNWNAVQKHSGLARCGKSCRLRWANHLRPNLKKGVITPAEELKIVELHAKMGNKWARMAAHLPGRTDNEIKNFWNTRIKRLQRIGMPPYPPEMQFDASNEGLQTEGAGVFSNVYKDQNDFLQGSGYNINPALLFDNHKAAIGPLSYTPFLGSTPMTRMMTQGFGSKSLAITNPIGDQLKRPRESELAPGFPSTLPAGLSTFQQFSTMPAEKIHKGIGFSSPYDPAPFSSRNLNPYATFSGSHALLNGNTSTSQSSTGKLELPSLQYAGGWLASTSSPPLQPISSYIPSPATTYIQSPANSIQSDCISIRNNGLLDALLPQSSTVTYTQSPGTSIQSDCISTRNNGLLGSLLPQSSTVTYTQSPETSIQSDCISTRNNGLLGSLLPQSQGLENNDPQSPLGFTASSLFNQSPLISCSSFDDLFPSKTTSGSELMLGDTELVSTPGEQDGPARSECLRPDALFEADWHANSFGVQKDHYPFNEVVTSFLGEDLCSEENQMASGGSSYFTQDMILKSYQWNTAPHIGTMSQNL